MVVISVESPAFANQASSYNAEQTRRAVFSWAKRSPAGLPGIIAGGLAGATDCHISAPTSGMTVNVSPGEMLIGGSEGGAQGGYYAKVASTTNLPIAAANANNPRIDTIVGTISDSAYTEPTGGSGDQWALQVITGVAEPGATLINRLGASAVPASSLVLGYVLVPATTTSIITADILNVATPVIPEFIDTTGIGDGQPIVYNAATGTFRTLAANNGNATFLQLLAEQQLAINCGSATFAFTQGSPISGGLTVPHGLGRVPKFWAVQINSTATTDVNITVTSTEAADATDLYLYAVTSATPDSAFSENAYWVAIG